MNERPDGNWSGENHATGNFKLHIDEKDLATGSYDLPDHRRGQTASFGPPPSSRSAYMTEKERKEEKKAHKKRDKLKARKNKRVFSLVWLCMVLLVSFTLASYLIGGSNDFFAVGRIEGTAQVEIPEHVTEEELAQILFDKGAISKKEFFTLYCKVTADMEYFQPGVYEVKTNLDYEDLINTLQGGNETREVVTVTIPEGQNALEIAQLLEENEVCSAEDFLAELNGDFTNYDIISELGDTSGKYYKLEGYLFPDTYDFWKGEELESVVGKLLNNFQNKVGDDVKAMVQKSGMTLDQVVTMASIIQGEAAGPNDMYDVSAVLHNRLNFGADYGIYRLECDSTSYYPYKNAQAVPETGALSYGGYDTYQVEGLPAGAICNPGMDAIIAALRPSADGDAPYYLYFCHAEDGTAYYATTEEGHLENLYEAGLME